MHVTTATLNTQYQHLPSAFITLLTSTSPQRPQIPVTTIRYPSLGPISFQQPLTTLTHDTCHLYRQLLQSAMPWHLPLDRHKLQNACFNVILPILCLFQGPCNFFRLPPPVSQSCSLFMLP